MPILDLTQAELTTLHFALRLARERYAWLAQVQPDYWIPRRNDAESMLEKLVLAEEAAPNED